MDVHLEVLDAAHPRREAVLALHPGADVVRWSSAAASTLPAADADPDRVPFAVVADDDAVGFGVLDRVGYLADLVDDPGRALLLRAFYVDEQQQGRGIGGRAARAVRQLATQLGADLVVLTVNVENPSAAAAYRRGGFVDTGARYLGGDNGPQHVYVAAALPADPQARVSARST